MNTFEKVTFTTNLRLKNNNNESQKQYNEFILEIAIGTHYKNNPGGEKKIMINIKDACS